MTEIAVSSILDIDQTTANITAEGIWSIKSLCDADNSSGEISQIRCSRAINSVLDADNSSGDVTANALSSIRAWLDVDNSSINIYLNDALRILSDWNCSNKEFGKFKPSAIHRISSEIKYENRVAAVTLNQCNAVAGRFEVDVSKALLQHLYLKNPPLPPEIGKGIEVRGARISTLNKAKLIKNNTYTLDAIVNGARLDGLHFVFTVKDYRNPNLILLQKSTVGIPDNLLSMVRGRGDVIIGNTTPVVSGRLGAVQEALISIIIKPDDFKLIKASSQLAYEFWVYDLMGSNTLLEAGVFSLISL